MLPISKYHGCGNDFVIVREKDFADFANDPGAFAAKICSRHTGAGADGLIIVCEDPLEMWIFNSDGSRAPMCGNGIRCFAHFCLLEGLTDDDSYTVKTLAGDMNVSVLSKGPFFAEIDLGKPEEDKGDGPFCLAAFARQKGPSPLSSSLEVSCSGMDAPMRFEVSSIFLGAMHTVVWLGDDPSPGAEGLLGDDCSVFDLAEDSEAIRIARAISEHPHFPDRTNVNLAKVTGPKKLELVTYERGAGLTLACGTGAASTVVIGYLEGRLENEVSVAIRLGELNIRIREDGHVFMNGPSERIMKGYYHGSD